MKTLLSAILLTCSFNCLATGMISEVEISRGFNPSIRQHLPKAIRCTSYLPLTKEFAARVRNIYLDKADLILARVKRADLKLEFKPFYGFFSTYAKTNMAGTIKINNVHSRSLISLTNTVTHETFHNLGFRHSDDIQPDVTETLGEIVQDMVAEGLCK